VIADPARLNQLVASSAGSRNLARRIEIRAFVGDIRADLSDRDLMKKHGVSPRELCSLMLQAADMGLINLSELQSVGNNSHPLVQLDDCRAFPRNYVKSGLSIYESCQRAQAIVLDISERGFRVKGVRAGVTEAKDFELVAEWCHPPYRVNVVAKCRWTVPAQERGDCVAGFEVVAVKSGNLKHLCEGLSSLANATNPWQVAFLRKSFHNNEKPGEPAIADNLRRSEADQHESKMSDDEWGSKKALVTDATLWRSTHSSVEHLGGKRRRERTGSVAKVVSLEDPPSHSPGQYHATRSSPEDVVGACALDGTELAIEGFSNNGTVWDLDSQSKIMRDVLEKCRMAARSDSSVLLQGATGTGKDYLAEHIHRHSKRAAAPYQSFNCSAIPPELAESELFGHEAGAFTGANSRKKGLLTLAPRGTLLLNEVGELPLMVQAKLLTFLDTKRFRPVGGHAEISVDTRIMAATNRNLEEEVSKRTFRPDLFYRLNVLSIRVPALRERIEDLPSLIQNLVASITQELGPERTVSVDRKTLTLLQAYEWPGNIRELRNRLERSLVLSNGRKISFSLMFNRGNEDKWPLNVEFDPRQNFNEFVQETRRLLVVEALKRSQGNRQVAAKMLGITRYSLKRHMTNLGLMGE
jgi:DNA-binding NtrC family response regulator